MKCFFQTLITCSLKQQLFLCEVELYIIINYNIYVDSLYHSIANYDNTVVFVLTPHTLDSQLIIIIVSATNFHNEFDNNEIMKFYNNEM